MPIVRPHKQLLWHAIELYCLWGPTETVTPPLVLNYTVWSNKAYVGRSWEVNFFVFVLAVTIYRDNIQGPAGTLETRPEIFCGHSSSGQSNGDYIIPASTLVEWKLYSPYSGCLYMAQIFGHIWSFEGVGSIWGLVHVTHGNITQRFYSVAKSPRML